MGNESLPLFVERSGGGYYMPHLELTPGVFVESCVLFERSPRLEIDEIVPLMQAWRGCTWTGIGYEAGRSLLRRSFRADVRDSDVLYPQNWYVGEAGVQVRLGGLVFREPGAEPRCYPETFAEERTLRLRPWAVEFSKADRGDGKPGFVRRRFWFASRHRVPTIAVRTRSEVRTAQEREAVGRLVSLLAEQRQRAARGAA